MTKTGPQASVIIPTRGRDACVRQTLRDLAAQDFGQFDIWLADQNAEPLRDLHLCVGDVFLHHEVMPPLGSHAGRNRAIFKTQAPLCIFVDDDVRVPPNFVRAHARAMETAAHEVGALAGRVVQPRDALSEEQMKALGRPARYNPWVGLVSGNFFGPGRADVEHIHECNFSARTEALRDVGGFNEEFRGNAYFEGADLALRLIDAGYKVQYRPEISLTHLQESAGGNRLSEKAAHTYWFMRNYGLLNSLHMRRVGLPAFGVFGIAYVMAKAMKNSDSSIMLRGLSGFWEGLKYFIPGTPRLRRGGSRSA